MISHIEIVFLEKAGGIAEPKKAMLRARRGVADADASAAGERGRRKLSAPGARVLSRQATSTTLIRLTIHLVPPAISRTENPIFGR